MTHNLRQSSDSPASDSRRRYMKLASGLLLASPAISLARQEQREVRWVVGYSPGGGADTVARLIASTPPLADRPTIVENKPGAGGRIALVAVKNRKPNERQYYFGPSSILTLMPHVIPDLPYDLFRDFRPVSTVCSFPYALVVSPDIGVDSIEGLLDWATKNPDKAFFGTPGVGLPQHLIGTLLSKLSGVPLQPVHFKSGSEATQMLLSGQLPIAIATPGQFYQLHRAGRVRMLATTGRARPERLPEVVTFSERGFDSMVFEDSFCLLCTKSASDQVVQELQPDIATALDTPVLQKALRDQDVPPLIIQGEAYSDYLREEHNRWAQVVKDVGFKL